MEKNHLTDHSEHCVPCRANAAGLPILITHQPSDRMCQEYAEEYKGPSVKVTREVFKIKKD